jgi:hypothetical protein
MSQARAAVGDITAVVTYDVSRLYMLEGLCLLWSGPLAAAVYVVGLHCCGSCSARHLLCIAGFAGRADYVIILDAALEDSMVIRVAAHMR